MRAPNPVLAPPFSKRRVIECRAAKIATILIDLDDLLIKKTGSAALSPQARLLLGLLIHGSMQMKVALMYTPLSYRAFYIMITKLKAQALIQINGVEGDRRIRRVKLGRRSAPIIKLLAANGHALAEKVSASANLH